MSHKTEKTLIVVEDSVTFNLVRNKMLMHLLLSRKELNLTIVLSCQHYVIPPRIQNNIDVLILGKNDILSENRRNYDKFITSFDNFSKFSNFIKTLDSYEFLYQENRMVTTIKAPYDIKKNTKIFNMSLKNENFNLPYVDVYVSDEIRRLTKTIDELVIVRDNLKRLLQ